MFDYETSFRQLIREVSSSFNPYLEGFKLIGGLENRGVFSAHLEKFYYYKHLFQERFGYAIPNQEALLRITKYSPVLEMGAGSGYWASLLQKTRCDIIAFDNFSWKFREEKGFEKMFFPVQRGSIEVIPEHSNRALMLCWPDYRDSFASDALQTYMNSGGHTLIYIGEGEGGCTGDDKFHEMLADFERIEDVNIPRWPGVNDHLMIYDLLSDA